MVTSSNNGVIVSGENRRRNGSINNDGSRANAVTRRCAAIIMAASTYRL